MSGPPGGGPVPAGAPAHLVAADPVLGEIVARVGTIELRLEPDLWWSLVDAIVSQQLSVAAAATIVGRIRALGDGSGPPGPEQILATPDDQLRALGLSRAKAVYVKDLAARWLDGTLQQERIPEMEDEEVIERLVAVKGIGRWTAEMALIFSLGRPDVLPLDDLGLREAARIAYGLAERPGRDELTRLGEPWRPYRTAASLYLWRSRRLQQTPGSG
jgi:DNA-3-methyladenine glycosylase II